MRSTVALSASGLAGYVARKRSKPEIAADVDPLRFAAMASAKRSFCSARLDAFAPVALVGLAAGCCALELSRLFREVGPDSSAFAVVVTAAQPEGQFSPAPTRDSRPPRLT